MLSIIAQTPAWVWAVLAALVALGLRAMRPRRIGQPGLIVMPLVFLLLSGWGALHAPGPATMGWAAFLVLGGIAGAARAARLPVRREGDALLVPGGADVLVVSLLIFATQYVQGVLAVMAPSAIASPVVRVAIQSASGLGTGWFLGKALGLLRRLHGGGARAT